MNNENKSSNFWLGFLLGGIFGAFLIFLLGTREGKRLAKKIIEKGELFDEDLEEKVEKLQANGKKFLKQAEDVKEKVSNETNKDKKKIGSRLINKMDKALTKIESIQKKGVEVTSKIHKRHFKKNGKPLN